MDIISPMYDFMFKRMFSIPGNKDMLCDFLSSCINFNGEELKNVKLIDKEIKRTNRDKESILDLRVEVGSPEAGISEVDVEVQLKKYNSFKHRAAYYLAKMFSDQLCEGENYSKLHKCVSLCVLDFPLFDDEQYFRSMLIRDEYGNVLTDKMEFDCLEVSKIKDLELNDKMDKRLQWAKLFAASSEEDLNMVNENANNPAINQAVLTIKKLSATEEMRLEALNFEKAYKDRISMLADERAEGRAEEKAKIIAKMRASGMSEDQIKAILTTKVQDNEEDEDMDFEL